jgi:hypothetical protein
MGVKIATIGRAHKEKMKANRKRTTDFFNVLLTPVGSLGVPVPISVPRLSMLRTLSYPEYLGASSSETSVNLYQTIRRHVPEKSNLHSARRRNLYGTHAENISS